MTTHNHQKHSDFDGSTAKCDQHGSERDMDKLALTRYTPYNQMHPGSETESRLPAVFCPHRQTSKETLVLKKYTTLRL